MEKTIEFPVPMGTATFKENELTDLYNDYSFLADSVLVLLNPEVAEKSDLPFNKEETIKHLKEFFKEGKSYDKEFIDKIFAKFQ